MNHSPSRLAQILVLPIILLCAPAGTSAQTQLPMYNDTLWMRLIDTVPSGHFRASPQCAAYSPAREALVVGYNSGLVAIYATRTGFLLDSLAIGKIGSKILHVSISDDGRRLAVQWTDNPPTFRKTTIFELPSKRVLVDSVPCNDPNMGLSSDGRFVAFKRSGIYDVTEQRLVPYQTDRPLFHLNPFEWLNGMLTNFMSFYNPDQGYYEVRFLLIEPGSGRFVMDSLVFTAESLVTTSRNRDRIAVSVRMGGAKVITVYEVPSLRMVWRKAMQDGGEDGGIIEFYDYEHILIKTDHYQPNQGFQCILFRIGSDDPIGMTTNYINGYPTTASSKDGHYLFTALDRIIALDMRRSVTSITESHTDTVGMAYPNPSTGAVTLNLASCAEMASMSVTDVTGNVVYSGSQPTRTATTASACRSVELNLRELVQQPLSAGMYAIRVATSNQVETFRVVLM